MSGYDFDAANYAALFFGLGDWYFLSGEEKQSLHKEKLSLPGFGEQSLEAKKRLKQRIENRKK